MENGVRNNLITIDLTSAPMDGKYRHNFNRFYFLLVLCEAVIIFIFSVIMEAFRDQFTATEFLSYKEVLYDEATEEWYAQRIPDEVEHEERNCMRLARQFCHHMKEHRDRFFTYVLFHPSTGSVAAHLESCLLHIHYTSELDNLYDDKISVSSLYTRTRDLVRHRFECVVVSVTRRSSILKIQRKERF